MVLNSKNQLWVIILTVFIDLLGVGILIPVIPLLLADPRSKYFLLSPSTPLGTGYLLLGILLTMYPLAQFIAAPILGQLSDKFGRRKVLAISLTGTSISYLLFAIGIHLRYLPLLFMGRILDGITGGNISVAQAAIADITTPDNRSKNFGLIGAAFGIGFVFGPFIGGVLSDPRVVWFFDAATPFWFAFVLSAFNVLFVLWSFPETLQHISHDLKINWDKSIHNILKAANMSTLKTLFLTQFLNQSGFSFFTTFLGVYLISRLAFTQSNIGNLFAYIGIWIAITQGIITRKLSSLGESTILRYTILGTGLSIFLYLLPNHWWYYLIIVPIFAIQNGLTQANLTALTSRSVDQKVQGEVLGIASSVSALAQTIPPIISGIIASRFSPSTPILIAGVIISFAGLYFNLFHHRRKVLHLPV